ncbi:MAG: indole-3-glycerol phosphate synthase TrpC [Candidatus Syntropharchaeia archaeon]
MSHEIGYSLEKIVERTKERIKNLDFQKEKRESRNVLERIKYWDKIPVISEIKPASPSGKIREVSDPLWIAKEMIEGGAFGISVLTEPHYFNGNVSYLERISSVFDVPVLRKDFIIHEGQIYESAHYGADMVLLIASILRERDLERLYDLAKECGLYPVIEVGSREEIERSGFSDIIMINNRNLKDLSIDLSRTEKLIRYIPEKKIVIGASGIKNREDVERMMRAGCDGVLVGTSIMKSKNVREKVKELTGIIR